MNELQGRVLGNRYTLVEKIGEGGMALVYKAKCELLNRYVAVKILRPEFTTDEDFVSKFKRESLAAASLSHPNVVGIYDVGEEEGIYYIVMEYVSGKTLKKYISENGRLNYREALNITSQIASALEHAHKNGVVHRDIKPHNILVTEDKIIKVTDFGIARASSSSTMANTGSIMGSVHYFSPEQARGGFTDHRTDIYSLGVVMYEMLTGSLPYDAESPVTVAIKHIQEDFVEPTIVDKTIPEGVNDIVKRAMEKDMTMRYQTVRELIDDIEIARNNPYTKIFHKNNANEMTRTIPVEDIDKELSKQPRPVKKTRKKAVIITVSVLLMVAALTTLAVYGYNRYFIVKDVTIPTIVGLDKAEAEAVIKNSKLEFAIASSEHSDKPVDQVTRVFPDEGTVVKENSLVRVNISAGPEKVAVPDLLNQNSEDIDTILKNANLAKGTVDHEFSDSVAKGKVISQLPLPNDQADAGSQVNVTISDGKEIKIVKVPEIIGKTLSEAAKLLNANNLQVGKISHISDNNFPDNVVIDINIAEGTPVPEGQEVDLTVNTLNSNSNSNTNTDSNGNTNTDNSIDNSSSTLSD